MPFDVFLTFLFVDAIQQGFIVGFESVYLFAVAGLEAVRFFKRFGRREGFKKHIKIVKISQSKANLAIGQMMDLKSYRMDKLPLIVISTTAWYWES